MNLTKLAPLLLLTSCFPMASPASPPAPPPPSDAQNGCAFRLEQVETTYCPAGQPRMGAAASAVEQQVASLRSVCHEPASLARVEAMERGCVLEYRAAATQEQGDREALREAKKANVAAVLADPAYRQLLDDWQLAFDEASLARKSWETYSRNNWESEHWRIYTRRLHDLEARDGALRGLFRKHGIEPVEASQLGLWTYARLPEQKVAS